MQSLPSDACTLPAGPKPAAMEEAIYKVVTVGAILLVLGSLWAF
jgi:hypothetical protein